MIPTASFPIVDSLDQWRTATYKAEHDDKKSLETRALNWFAHKGLCLLSIPANSVATAAGCIGMLASACTLGAVKVSFFALTLGRELQFSTGFNFLFERTVTSVSNIAETLGELFHDALDLSYQAYLQVKSLLVALKLDFVADLLRKGFDFVIGRLEAGIEVSLKDEEPLVHAAKQLPYPLYKLNRETEKRSCFVNSHQPLQTWFTHKLFSAINIPVNTVVAVTSTLLGIAGAIVTCAKAVLYATTNIHLPIPTGVGYTCIMAAKTFTNLTSNLAEVGVDLFVLVYRIAELLRINQAIATVAQLIAYVPRAVFS